MKLGNGKWEHTSFNNRLQPTLIGLGTSTSDSSVLQLDYTYNTTGQTNNNGNVVSQTITIGTTVMTDSFGYDALNRLSSASETGAASWSQNYGFDRFGNRWFSSGSYLPNPTLTPQSVAAYGDQSNNRLSASQYDNAGNLTLDAASSAFTYDAENRQISSNVGGTYVTYNYDGDGRRVKKVVGTSTTIFVYNAAGQLIAEYTSPDQISTNGLSYLTSDHLGSTRVVTDINGNVKSRHDYLPFGEEIGTDHCPAGLSYGATDGERQKFTQKERDSESGLDYFGARYYSSAQGRFTSADPLLSSGTIYDPRTWNRYTYTLNNPLKYVDALGLYEFAANATDEQKKRFRQALVDVEKARDKFKIGSEKYNRLNDARNAYGKEGDKNGVSVGFEKFTGKEKDTGGRTTPSFQSDAEGKVTANITVIVNTSVVEKRDELATVAAHEGQHTADAQAFAALDWVKGNVINSPLNRNQYQLEFRGYEITSFMLQAQGNEDARYEGVQLWSSGWKEPDKATLKRTEAINKYLEKSPAYPNARPSNPGRRYVEP